MSAEVYCWFCKCNREVYGASPPKRRGKCVICKHVIPAKVKIGVYREFDDLIKEIEVNGEKFIPVIKIAALAFNYNENAVQKKSKSWVNDSYDCACWHTFEPKIIEGHKCMLHIWRDFCIGNYHVIGETKTEFPSSNQVKIFKLLQEWNFI